MFTTLKMVALAATLVAGFASTTVAGDLKIRKLVADKEGTPTGYFAKLLGAEFEISTMQIPGFVFKGARIVSVPVEGSPLDLAGLEIGDVITRLDGVPVTRNEELDRHALKTVIRFIKFGTVTPKNTEVFIPPQVEPVLDDEVVELARP